MSLRNELWGKKKSKLWSTWAKDRRISELSSLESLGGPSGMHKTEWREGINRNGESREAAGSSILHRAPSLCASPRRCAYSFVSFPISSAGGVTDQHVH